MIAQVDWLVGRADVVESTGALIGFERGIEELLGNVIAVFGVLAIR